MFASLDLLTSVGHTPLFTLPIGLWLMMILSRALNWFIYFTVLLVSSVVEMKFTVDIIIPVTQFATTVVRVYLV